MDKLTPIAKEHWGDLRDLFKSSWPNHEIPFNIIQNYIKWIGIDPRIKHLRVFSLNGSWRTNGTFIIIDRYELYCYTLEDSNESLSRALKLVDWDYSYFVCAVAEQHQPALESALEVNPEPSELNQILHLPKEKAIHFDIIPPEGFRLAALGPEYASHINASWPYHFTGSEYTIKRCLAWNSNVGLFNESGDMIGWCLHNTRGLLGFTHVDEQYRNRGLGALIVRAISKKLAEQGQNAYGAVTPDNGPSLRLFQKLGFVQKCTAFWTRTPAQKLVEWNVL